MSKQLLISTKQRSQFIEEMDKKWRRKHNDEEAWLDRIGEFADLKLIS